MEDLSYDIKLGDSKRDNPQNWYHDNYQKGWNRKMLVTLVLMCLVQLHLTDSWWQAAIAITVLGVVFLILFVAGTLFKLVLTALLSAGDWLRGD